MIRNVTFAYNVYLFFFRSVFLFLRSACENHSLEITASERARAKEGENAANILRAKRISFTLLFYFTFSMLYTTLEMRSKNDAFLYIEWYISIRTHENKIRSKQHAMLV